MFSSRKLLSLAALPVCLAMGSVALAQGKYQGIGRDATPKEVAAWDIDVRPDFKGLPKGSGSVAQGQDIWEAKCAQCHGFFGESGEVFNPLVGGVSKEDIATGRVSKLRDPSYPGRTTFMKVATVSTIWDYINRAMPWTSPKSLQTDEVYAVTAFLLNLNGVLPDNFTLSDQNIADVQKKMPNRNGMTTQHALWPGKEHGGVAKADTSNTACMKNCVAEAKVTSLLPDHARNAHGNLAEQNRLVGAQHGADTSRPEGATAKPGAVPAAAPAVPRATASEGKAAIALLNKHSCTACHGIDKKIVGPAYTDVAKKYPDKADYLVRKIKEGGSGVWGAIPMPPQTLSDADAGVIARWIAAGAPK
jgi:cytochrome c551/c552